MYKSRVVDVGALVAAEARGAAARARLETALEAARAALAQARAAAASTQQAERGAQTQLSDLAASLAAARARLTSLTVCLYLISYHSLMVITHSLLSLMLFTHQQYLRVHCSRALCMKIDLFTIYALCHNPPRICSRDQQRNVLSKAQRSSGYFLFAIPTYLANIA
jgi:multidrug efflux pump subunit AcrA (membrane-fusion protein)